MSKRFKEFKKYCKAIHPNGINFFAAYAGGAPIQLKKKDCDERTYNVLKGLNDTGYDIYIVVAEANGFKDVDIHGARYAIADWDVGRDENGNYYPEEVVAVKKREKLQDWKAQSEVGDIPEPTILVSTRNGIHLYWAVPDIQTAADYKSLILSIAQNMGTDTSIVNPARVLRCPGFLWRKVAEGLPPHLTSIRKLSPQNIYTYEEMVGYFPYNEECDYLRKNYKRTRVYTNGGVSCGTYWIQFAGEEPFSVEAFMEGGQLHAGCKICNDTKQHDIVIRVEGMAYCNRCKKGAVATRDKTKLYRFQNEEVWKRITEARKRMSLDTLSQSDLDYLDSWLHKKFIERTPEDWITRDSERAQHCNRRV